MYVPEIATKYLDFPFRVVDGFAIFGWWLRHQANEPRNYHDLQQHPEGNVK